MGEKSKFGRYIGEKIAETIKDFREVADEASPVIRREADDATRVSRRAIDEAPRPVTPSRPVSEARPTARPVTPKHPDAPTARTVSDLERRGLVGGGENGGIFGTNKSNPSVSKVVSDSPTTTPRAHNDDGIDETALRRTADQPRPLANAVAAEREVGPVTKVTSQTDANAPRMSADNGGSGSGPSGTGTSGGGGSSPPPPGGSSPPPPPPPNGGGNGAQALTPEAIDRQNKWKIQEMVMGRLGAIDEDFLRLRRGERLSQAELNTLEKHINVGGLFSKDAPRVNDLDELIDRVNIPGQKAIKASGLDNFYDPKVTDKIHPDDFKKFVRGQGLENEAGLAPLPGISGPLSRASSSVKGQSLKPAEVGQLKSDLADIGRINDNLDPKDFRDIKTPAQLDQYFRESPRNAIPGSVFDKVVGETSRQREVSSIGIGKFRTPELTRKEWKMAAAATFTAITAPVALDAVAPDTGVSLGYYTSAPVRTLVEGAQIAASVAGAENKLSSGGDYKLFLAQNNTEFREKLIRLATAYGERGSGKDYAEFLKTNEEFKGMIPADIEAGLYLRTSLEIDPITKQSESIKANAALVGEEAGKLAADRGKTAQVGLNDLNSSIAGNAQSSTETTAGAESTTNEVFNIAKFARDLKSLGFPDKEISTVQKAYNEAAEGSGINQQKLRTGLQSLPPEHREAVISSLPTAPSP